MRRQLKPVFQEQQRKQKDEVDLCVGRIHDIVLSEKMKAKYNLGLINNIKEELKVYSKGE